jgi:site-specific DNA-methyltransferase (adenine-specific)
MSKFRTEVIGDARLILGDCREVLPTLGLVDGVVTDPPYGIGFAAQPTRYQRANGMAAVAWDDARPQDVVDQIVAQFPRAIIWGGNYFALRPSRGWLVWSKSGNAPSMADLEMAWTSLDMNARAFEKSVKSASLEKNLQTAAHPSQKPVGLMEWSIGFIPGSGAILDPFAGSGTTGVACVRRDRPFVGIEVDPGYFDIACRRIEEPPTASPVCSPSLPPSPNSSTCWRVHEPPPSPQIQSSPVKSRASGPTTRSAQPNA